MQKILTPENDFGQLDAWLRENGTMRLLLVCDDALPYLTVNGYFNTLESRFGIAVERFSAFEPNPRYESVTAGVTKFQRTSCDTIAAVGGGSAIDVAKCIKLYAGMDPAKCYLKQTPVPNNIPLLAIPTTAGTGSEATRFAVIYHQGEKQSVADDSILPAAVLLDPSVLETLPFYQRKSTMLDALCHTLESFWSVNSTAESRKLSARALQQITENQEGYLANAAAANAEMQQAAYIAGQAINITQTTAGHAMCYKLTSLYGIAHGHAAILCVRILYPWMIENTAKCIDSRGREYLARTLDGIGQAMGCANAKDAAGRLNEIFLSLDLQIPEATGEQFRELTASVNPVRLKNHPVALDERAISELYHKILRER